MKKKKYAGSLPGKIGRSMRREGVIRSSKARVTTAMVPAEPVVVFDPERELHLRSLVARFSGDLNRKAMKIRFLALIAPGADQLRLGPAWRACHPRTKATDVSCTERGSAFYAEILSDLGPDPHPADILALLGIHVGSVGKDLQEARGAMFVREFYDAKAGIILTGKERPDFLVRLRAVELSMKAIGLGKEKEGTGPVVINIVSYLGGDPATAHPWSGGGRVAADGVLHDTVGPKMYRPSLPAGSVTIDLGDRKGERDD